MFNRATMIVHAFMIELDQLHYWYPRKIKKLRNFMYKVNGELFSCDITDSGRVPSREGDIQNCIISSKRIIHICSNFYCWVSKIAFYSPDRHSFFCGNFPFKCSMYIPLVEMRSINYSGYNVLPLSNPCFQRFTAVFILYNIRAYFCTLLEYLQ